MCVCLTVCLGWRLRTSIIHFRHTCSCFGTQLNGIRVRHMFLECVIWFSFNKQNLWGRSIKERLNSIIRLKSNMKWINLFLFFKNVNVPLRVKRRTHRENWQWERRVTQLHQTTNDFRFSNMFKWSIQN